MKWCTLAVVVFHVTGHALAAGSEANALKEAEEHNNRGAHLAGEGQYGDAVEAFNSAIRAAPAMVVSYYNLGLAYARMDEFVRAQEAFETAVRIRPENGNVWFHLGRALQSQEKIQEALEAYTVALRRKPADPDVRYWLGVASWFEKNWSQAAAQWEALIVENPDHAAFPKAWEELPRAYFNLGTARRESGDLDKAVEAYKEALRLRPDYADAHLNLGDLYGDSGKYSLALASLRRVERLRPDDIRVYLGLGVVYLGQDSLRLAQDQFSRALELDKRSAEAQYGLATSYLRQGKVEEALKSALQLLLMAPNETRSHKLLAFIHEHNDEGVRYGGGFRAEEAIRAYANALRLDPEDAGMYFSIGTIFGRSRNWQEAYRAYTQALVIDSLHAETLKWLPLVEEKLREGKEVQR